MALSTAPMTIEAARAVLRARGEAQRVVVRLDDALAGPMEGTAFAAEVLAHVNRIVLAAASDAPRVAIDEAHRLGQRALRARDEFRRIAAGIEGGPDAA